MATVTVANLLGIQVSARLQLALAGLLAALLAVAIISANRPELREKLRQYRAAQTEAVMKDSLP